MLENLSIMLLSPLPMKTWYYGENYGQKFSLCLHDNLK